jgi:type IV pilus assembly protein PilV
MVTNMPAGRGISNNNSDGLVVTVMWDDEGTGATGTNCGPDPAVDLTCYTLVVAQ